MINVYIFQCCTFYYIFIYSCVIFSAVKTDIQPIQGKDPFISYEEISNERPFSPEIYGVSGMMINFENRW